MGQYESRGCKRYPDFETPQSDAIEFATLLRDSDLHFEPENFKVLIDVGKKEI